MSKVQRNHRKTLWIGWGMVVLTLCLPAGNLPPAEAQTLARPGWIGSGLQGELWWRHAVFLTIDVGKAAGVDGDASTDARRRQTGGIEQLTERLDGLHTLGIDALVLEGVRLSPVQSQAAPVETPSAPIEMPPAPIEIQPPAETRTARPGIAAGAVADVDSSGAVKVGGHPDTLEDFDLLVREAARRHIRVLLSLPLTEPGPGGQMTTETLARLWLNHGIAGFRLREADATPQAPDQLRQLNQQLAGLTAIVRASTGERVLLADRSFVESLDAAPTRPSNPPNLRSVATSRRRYSRRPAGSLFKELLWKPDLEILKLNTAKAAASQMQAKIYGVNDLQFLGDLVTTAKESSEGAPGSRDVVFATLLEEPHVGAGDELPLSLQPAFTALLLTAPGAILLNDKPALLADIPALQAQTRTLPAETRTVPPSVESSRYASLGDLYRDLIALHNSTPALRTGETTFLHPGSVNDPGNPNGAANVLLAIRRPAAHSREGRGAPILVVSNLTSAPVHISLREDLKRLQVDGSVLRTLLTYSALPGATETLNDLGLGPSGIWIGEVTGRAPSASLTRGRRR